MCQALARDHDLTLFRPSATGPFRAAKIYEFYGVEPSFKIRRLPQPGSWTDRTLQGARLLRWEVALRRFDLVYARCNAWRPYRVDRIGRPLIVEAHLLRQAPRIARLLRSAWVRGLVVISDALRQDYAATHDLGDLKVLVAHDGADPPSAAGPARLPGAAPVKCGYVGNLYGGKGMEIVIPLARRCPHVDFHVFGGSADEVARWRATMGEAEPGNLWFHGALRPADTDAARLACDLLIAPYGEVVQGVGNTGNNLVRWMSPLKVFEYMAAGRAIVASDLPTLHEVLRHRENALLVPPNDMEAWARAIDGLAADADERRSLGARAHDDFVKQHSWQARARRIMEAFRTPEPTGGSLAPSARHIKL
jgi:glycosyltransferase involved in cell wall biosynthesis